MQFWWTQSEILEKPLGSRVKERASTLSLWGSMAINGDIRENELVQDMDAGLRRAFSKIKECGAYEGKEFAAQEEELFLARNEGGQLLSAKRRRKCRCSA